MPDDVIWTAREAMTGTCATCRFWLKWMGTMARPDIGGSCRRFPPSLSEQSQMAFHPATTSNTWCGEHQPKEPHD